VQIPGHVVELAKIRLGQARFSVKGFSLPHRVDQFSPEALR
jgi:hypothetical protein